MIRGQGQKTLPPPKKTQGKRRFFAQNGLGLEMAFIEARASSFHLRTQHSPAPVVNFLVPVLRVLDIEAARKSDAATAVGGNCLRDA